MGEFTLLDLLAIIKCLIVWFLVSTAQGYTIGALTNVLNFRSRTPLRQLSFSALLSMAVIPALLSLVGISIGAKYITYLALTLTFAAVVIIIFKRQRVLRGLRYIKLDLAANRAFLFVTAIWICLGITMLVDIQIGDKIYPSVTMYDHSAKVGLADIIARSGIPPSNPYFYPGHLVPVFYHYYWALLCTVISSICGSPYDTRMAVLAGVIWTGIVFLCAIDLGARYFKSAKVNSSLSVLFSFGLLAVSNLYALILMPINLAGLFFKGKNVYASLCWWTTEQVNPLVHAMTWVPHHIAGLSVGILASIFILQSSSCRSTKERAWLILLAGLALASSVGLSAYTAFGFSAGWGAWAIYNLFIRQYKQFFITLAVGLIGGFLLVPYLHEMVGGTAKVAGLIITIGKFEPIDWLIPALSHSSKFIHQVVYFFCLPLRYFLGMGFCFVAPILYWRSAVEERNSKTDTFLLVMALTTLTLGSLLHSKANSNDFGWRVILPAQFICLIWSGQLLALRRLKMGSLALSKFQTSLCIIGIFTFLYGLYLDRTGLAKEQDPGRMYALRSLYSSLSRTLPIQSVVQHNPRPTFLTVNFLPPLYSHRQMCCSEDNRGIPNVPDEGEYRRVTKDLRQLFNNASAARALDICHRYQINVIVVDDYDKLRADNSDWTKYFPVIAENDRARAFLVK